MDFLNDVWAGLRPYAVEAAVTIGASAIGLVAAWLAARAGAAFKAIKDDKLALSLYRTIDNVLKAILARRVLAGAPIGGTATDPPRGARRHEGEQPALRHRPLAIRRGPGREDHGEVAGGEGRGRSGRGGRRRGQGLTGASALNPRLQSFLAIVGLLSIISAISLGVGLGIVWSVAGDDAVVVMVSGPGARETEPKFRAGTLVIARRGAKPGAINVPVRYNVSLQIPENVTPGLWRFESGRDSQCPLRQRYDKLASAIIEVLP